MELTWNAEHPLALPGGEARTFLQDGDGITLRGVTRDGRHARRSHPTIYG